MALAKDPKSPKYAAQVRAGLIEDPATLAQLKPDESAGKPPAPSRDSKTK